MKREVVFEVIITVECPDELWDDLITDAARPGSERNMYGFTDEDQVVNHLAWNAVHNDYWNASSLDGWGDVPYGVLTMDKDIMYAG